MKVKNYLRNLYEDKVNKIITEEQFKELIKNYNEEKEMLKKQINSINFEINHCDLKFSVNINEIFNKYKELKKIDRYIIGEFIDKIYICKIDKEKIEEILYLNGILINIR